MAPMTKAGTPHSRSYVVCFDCGKQFEYDLSRMRIGKVIDPERPGAVAAPRTPSRAKRVTLGLLAAVPLALMFGSAWKGRKKARTDEPDDR